MGIVLGHILQWILRILLGLLLALLVIGVVILAVPIRYRVEGRYQDTIGIQGKITWFLSLLSMTFAYQDEMQIRLRIFGFLVYDTAAEKLPENQAYTTSEEQPGDQAYTTSEEQPGNQAYTKPKDTLENKADTKTEDLTGKKIEKQSAAKEKETVCEKRNKDKKRKKPGWKQKLEMGIQKVKNLWEKIRQGKLTIEHYLDLWHRSETQITFARAKQKLKKMVKVMLPGKWEVTGVVGLQDPCLTGQLMGGLGMLYPVIGNRIRIDPDFEHEVWKLQGYAKGHIRLGTLVYQLGTLLLNRHCFRFIKLVFQEIEEGKKK